MNLFRKSLSSQSVKANPLERQRNYLFFKVADGVIISIRQKVSDSRDQFDVFFQIIHEKRTVTFHLFR